MAHELKYPAPYEESQGQLPVPEQQGQGQHDHRNSKGMGGPVDRMGVVSAVAVDPLRDAHAGMLTNKECDVKFIFWAWSGFEGLW